MWARKRELTTALVVLSIALAFQPTASGEAWTAVPVDSLENGNVGMVVQDVYEDYVTINLSTSDPDVIQIPVIVMPDGAKAARGLLRTASQEEAVLMPVLGDDDYVLVLNQDWPQGWDELVIELSGQDWPQYVHAIVPLDFQDWPQAWLPAELV